MSDVVKKKFYLSKMFWVNLIAIIGLVAFNTEEVSPQLQVSILAAVNIILRFFTKEEVTW